MAGNLLADTNLPVVAVLPLSSGAGDEVEPDLAVGLHEEICRELSRFRNLRVVSPASVAAVDDRPDPDISALLGATHVLRGRIRRQGHRIQLSAVLSDARTSTLLWSEAFEDSDVNLFSLEDELVARIAATLSARLDADALAAGQRASVDLDVVALVMRGRAILREGGNASDAEARAWFERALELDPSCARARAGIASSWFNEWSCQYWDRFEENGQLAYKNAHQALALDDRDALLHQIIGKIHLFRRRFERASWYFDRALALCPNDADILIDQAYYDALLGRPEKGVERAERAMRLNPYHPPYYFGLAAVASFVAGDVETAVALGTRSTSIPFVDAQAYWAAALVRAGRLEDARASFVKYEEAFREKILFGRKPEPGEAVRWFADMNPFRKPEHLALFLDAFAVLGAENRMPEAPTPPAGASFHRNAGGWTVEFAGRRAALPDLKGIQDICHLLVRPMTDVHCLDLSGRHDDDAGSEVLDDRARSAIKARIRDLQETLAEAEEMNDIGRAEAARAEMDQLLETLSAALGLGGRSRRLGDLAEKARTSVTWRIRHAVRRIETAHPELGRHLANSIRTGTFCRYSPEQPVAWRFELQAPRASVPTTASAVSIAHV